MIDNVHLQLLIGMALEGGEGEELDAVGGGEVFGGTKRIGEGLKVVSYSPSSWLVGVFDYY